MIHQIPAESKTSIEELLDRLRDGDREAGAELVLRFGPRIRQHVRRGLSRRARRLFDSQDVFSTVARRLDVMACRGGVEARTLAELIALISVITNHAIVDKAKAFERLTRTEREDGPFARVFEDRLREAYERGEEHGDASLGEAFEALEREDDRALLSLWLRGHDSAQIAELLRTTPGAVRGRWRTVRRHLERKFGT